MKHLIPIVRTHVLPHWRRMALMAFISLAVVTPLNLVTLLIFGALLHIVFRELEAESVARESAAPPPESADLVAFEWPDPPLSFDAGQWNGFFSQAMENAILGFGKVETVVTICALYLVVTLLIKSVELGTIFVLWRVRCTIAFRMFCDLFRHVTGLSLSFFNRSSTGDLLARISQDSFGVATGAYGLFLSLMQNVPLFIIYWAILLATSFKLSVVLVLVMLLRSAAILVISKRLKAAIINLRAASGKLNGRLQEYFSGINVVKSFSAEKLEAERMDALAELEIDHAILQGRLRRASENVGGYFTTLATVFILTAGLLMVVSGSIQASAFFLYFVVMTRAEGPSSAMVDIISQILSLQGTAKRYLEILEEKPSVVDGEEELPDFEESLRFRDVSFHYDKGEDVLQGVDFTLKKGEVVGIVGMSGSGKTTLLNLMLRFYDPQKGSVELDGRNVRDFRQSSYRRLFGVVSQEPMLFHQSVEKNITFAEPDGSVTMEEVVRVAEIAQADGFIRNLEEGYDTVLGDRGVRLSGGQRQRLTLARALLRNPPILILDEPTSSMDSESERLIQTAIDEFMKGRTAIVVAHRLSTLRNVDRIMVMDGGNISETGTHEELLALGGLYARFYALQSQGAGDLEEDGAAA